MKLIKQIEVPPRPATTRTELVGHACDICKAEFKGDRHDHGVEWGNDYEKPFTSVATGKTWHYPEGGGYAVREWHVCPNCFGTHLLPVLQEKAGEGTEERGDW